MYRKVSVAGLVALTVCLLVAGSALAHEGEHEGKSHKQGDSRFEEGSGSSVIDANSPGHEYSEKGEHHPAGKGVASEASTGSGQGVHPKGQDHEEGSRGMTGQHDPNKGPAREGRSH